MKSLFISIAMVAVLTACGHRASTDSNTEADSLSVDSIEALKVDSIGVERSDSMAGVEVFVDWPVSGSPELTEAIRHYICTELAARPYQEEPAKPQFTDNAKQVVSETVKDIYKSLSTSWKEARDEGYGGDMSYSYFQSVFLLESNERYVTYMTNSEGFMGGAHGFATSSGITFSTKTGRKISYHSEYDAPKETFVLKEQTLFKDTESAQFRKIIKEGVRSYFKEYENVVTDSQLKDMLLGIDNVNNIPLPSNAPFFTKDGLFFSYQQYEIAPYAAGMPSFSVKYDKIRPYLTDEAAELIP